MNKPYTEERPWGKFERFTLNELTTVKILTVKKGKRLSLQYHKNREELWKVLDNPVKITINEKTWIAKKDELILIGKEKKHRAEGLNQDVRILEISFGHFDENDEIKIEDDYNRI